MTNRAKIIAAVERDQRVRAKRIAKLRTCNLEVLERALETFQSPQVAGLWLIEETTAFVGLHGRAPIDATMTPAGCKAVLQLLDRIEYGIPP